MLDLQKGYHTFVGDDPSIKPTHQCLVFEQQCFWEHLNNLIITLYSLDSWLVCSVASIMLPGIKQMKIEVLVFRNKLQKLSIVSVLGRRTVLAALLASFFKAKGL